MTRIVFAMYRPNEGKDADLRALIAQHVPALRALGLVTKRDPVLVKSRNGSYVEIFEWISDDASRSAHEHPQIAEIWEQMGVVGTFGRLSQLAEANSEFPHFQPVEL